MTHFKGFTFFVEKKKNNKIENVFIHDKSNVLKNLTSDQSNKNSITMLLKMELLKKGKN